MVEILETSKRQAGEEYEEWLANVEELRSHVNVATFLSKRYPEYLPTLRYNSTVSIGYHARYVQLSLYNVDSLKYDLVELLDDLVSAGYDPSKFEDATNGDYRVFECGRLQVTVWRKVDSERCVKRFKRSQVWHTDEYEIVCLD